MSRTGALALYLGLTVPLGILTHVTAEAIGLHRNAIDVAFSPLHAYLGVLGLAALTAFGLALGATSLSELRRRAGLLAYALPFRGRGLAFAGLTAALQFSFVLMTLFAEGSPLGAGSLWIAILAAALASLFGGIALHVLRARLEVAVAATFEPHVGACVSLAPMRRRSHTFGPYYAFVPAHGNRPPPRPYSIPF
jgi:hypothetical protein